VPVEFVEEELTLQIGDGFGTSITFGPGAEHFKDGYDFVDVFVSVTAPRLQASTLVRSVEGDSPMALRAFMSGLATEWKGLPEPRTWESIEHDLTIHARPDASGHVILTFTVRENYLADAWTATVTLNVEPGEEMAGAAGAIERLLAAI
jgi:hypothetical protein